MDWNFFKSKKEKRGIEYVQGFSEALNFGQLHLNSTAMNLSAVYRATELISDSVAILPIKVQNHADGAKIEMQSHPLNLVFGDKANENNLSKYNLMKLLIQSVILRGNGFAYIDRADDGTVNKLRFLEPQDVTVTYDRFKDKLYYTVTTLRNKNVEPVNMIHLRKNTYDGINGISVISFAARTLNTSNATEKSAENFFANGCNLAGILTVNGQLQQKQKDEIRASWAQAYGSGSNGGLAVLQGNMQYSPIQISSKDAQMIESRQFNVQDIARFFGISPVLLGDLSHASYSTIEAVQQEFLLHTLQPYVCMVENEFNRKLLKPSEKSLSIILETNEILRTDKQAQADYYTKMLSNGVLSVNEVRKELGYNPITEGDKHIIPFTDLTMNTLEENNTKKEGEK